MADVNNNGILDDEEIAAYKARAAAGKFKQQIAYGVGAAMVFGLFTAISQSLFRSAFGGAVAGVGGAATTAAAASVWPIIGLVAIAAIGIGCLYLSAKFMSDNTFHDQDLQARQILAAQGKSPEITPGMEPASPAFPAAMLGDKTVVDAEKSDEAALSPAPEKKWADKFTASASPAAILSRAENDNERSWGAKVTAGKAADAATGQTLAAL